jgi:hypothetical protein
LGGELLQLTRAIIQYAYKFVYVVGILFIIGLTVVRLFDVGVSSSSVPSENQHTGLSATDISPKDQEATKVSSNLNINTQQADNSGDSLTTLVVKPIVDSTRNKVIFEGVFWFLVWILMFMLLPSGLLPLKRFKVFNLEFEIGEKEAAAIEKISQNTSKAYTMVNYTSEESVTRFFREFSGEEEVSYRQGLEFFLQDLVIGYINSF